MLIIKFIPSSFSDDTISKIFSDVIFRLSLSNPFILVLRWLTKVVNFWYNFGFFIFIPRNLTGLKREWSCFKMLPPFLFEKKSWSVDTIENNHSEGGTGENRRINPHLNFGNFKEKNNNIWKKIGSDPHQDWKFSQILT